VPLQPQVPLRQLQPLPLQALRLPPQVLRQLRLQVRRARAAVVITATTAMTAIMVTTVTMVTTATTTSSFVVSKDHQMTPVSLWLAGVVMSRRVDVLDWSQDRRGIGRIACAWM
jgi:mRNA-degrading endonuclease toxin of MazEF toxin-antitoxin module